MIWTALTIGLLGSTHCVGMCGPIALALPMAQRSKLQIVNGLLLYNLGRMVTYVLLGTIVGLLSRGLFLANVQSYISIGLGVALLIMAIFSFRMESAMMKSAVFGRWYLNLKVRLGQLLQNNTNPTLFKIGILNGFLPCGLVYMAILGAITLNSIKYSILYMVLFGIGTVPLMLLTGIGGQLMSFKMRGRLKQLYPFFLVVFAGLLIMRGLNFEMPQNFSIWETWRNPVMCH